MSSAKYQRVVSLDARSRRTANVLLVIPGTREARDPTAFAGTNANAAGGAQRERQGWRESIGLGTPTNRFRIPPPMKPALAPE
jgi:hypothetical protein